MGKDDKKMTPRMKLGKTGEDAACEFLMKKGQTIVDRNCRKGHLEIDIISLDENGVHFVEVKSRMVPVSAAPEENVTPEKQKKIAKAALRYLNSSKDEKIAGDLEVNFDVVAVTFNGGNADIEYFPNAFIPMYV